MSRGKGRSGRKGNGRRPPDPPIQNEQTGEIILSPKDKLAKGPLSRKNFTETTNLKSESDDSDLVEKGHLTVGPLTAEEIEVFFSEFES